MADDLYPIRIDFANECVVSFISLNRQHEPVRITYRKSSHLTDVMLRMSAHVTAKDLLHLSDDDNALVTIIIIRSERQLKEFRTRLSL